MRDPAPIYPEFPFQPIFFKQHKFREELARRPGIGVFKDAIAGVSTHFNQQFAEGEDVRFLVSERSTFTDLILHYAWHQFVWGNDVCLLAVGGYGRQELHPHSDIDILILFEDGAAMGSLESVQQFIMFLWDIGLEVGSSVRTLSECIDIARTDITVVTNLMEARRLAGNDRLRDQLQIMTDPEHMWSISSFYTAKAEEQHERHKKFNYTEYDLEPNIKNSPGGLRDIQTVNWIAKRLFGVQTLRQLEGKNFFTELEFGVLRQGEAFLWRVRYGLHLLARRADERLLFSAQRELAQHFGYQDNEKGLAVEQFMHEYYRTVHDIRQITEVLLRVLNEKIHGHTTQSSIRKICKDFQLRDGFIEVTHPKVFEDNPGCLLEMFVRISEDESIRGATADTIRLIRESRTLIDDAFRENPRNRAMFLSLFRMKYGLVTQLKRMHRYGILGRYLPEFERITGQMQHDLFHRYTVDAHSLLVMKNAWQFSKESAKKDFPLAAEIVSRFRQPELLYIAALFHDIGKGRGGDHSQLGAVDAERFCINHGLSGRETRLVKWLVERHLLMSYVSQKKDISDPEVVLEFALEVGDQTHLDYLYALTVADMCGTNPDIWNSWRASLMRQLYNETKSALRRGLENTIDQQDIVTETQQKALAILVPRGLQEAEVREIWRDMPYEYFLREFSLDIAWQTEAIRDYDSGEPLILIRDIKHPPWDGATQIFVRAKDADNVFVAVSHSLAHQGLNIQDARIYNSKSGFTIDTFYVLDANYQPLGDDPARLRQIRKFLTDELKLAKNYKETVYRRTPRQLKQMAIPTRTYLNHDTHANVTVLEVISPDRPGLLATIGRIFLEFGVQLQNAKISTLGERVEDVFFITDRNKNPLRDPELCAALQRTICEQLDSQVRQYS